MNIALFPSAFHPSLGGVEELSRQLALELQRQGHRVRVYTERWPRDLPAKDTLDGLDIRRFPMRVPTASFKSKLNYALTHRFIRNAVVADLREFKADVLHVQCVSSTTLYALEAKKILRLPLVVTLQGELTMDAAGIFKRPGIAQEILRRALTEADHVTGCSGKTLKDGVNFYGKPLAQPSSVVFNGAKPDDFAKAKPHDAGCPYIFAMGRLVPQKGFDTLLEALPSSLPPGWKLLLAGDGPDRPKIEAAVKAEPVRDRVQYLGRADRAMVTSLLRGCEFLVVPSRADEGLPVVCAEAIAAGKPIIGTTMGGIPEAVTDGVNGLIIPPENAAALASALTTLSSTPELRARMSSAAKARGMDFAWSSIALKYQDAYKLAAANVR